MSSLVSHLGIEKMLRDYFCKHLLNKKIYVKNGLATSTLYIYLIDLVTVLIGVNIRGGENTTPPPIQEYAFAAFK